MNMKLSTMNFLNIFLLILIATPDIQGKLLLSENVNIARYGVIFENMGKINLVTASHNLVITFDSNNILESANKILEFMQDSINLIQKQEKHVLNVHCIYILKNIINQFESKFKIFKKYITTFDEEINRNNIDNSNIKNNDNDINNDNDKTTNIYLSQKFNDLIDKVDKLNVTNFIDKYISKISITQRNMSKINKAIYRANITYRALLSHYENKTSYLYNITRETALFQSLSFFEFCLRDFNEEIEQLLYKLDSIITTSKTSVLVITPDKFMEILKEVQNKVDLLYPPIDDFIPAIQYPPKHHFPTADQ